MTQIQATHCSGFQMGFIDFNKFGALILDIIHQRCTKTLYLFSGSVLLCAWAWNFPEKFNFILLQGQARCLSYSSFRSLTMTRSRCF